MLKRKSLLLFAAVIATIALFAVGEALAFNNGACYGWNYDDSIPLCTEPQVSDFCTIDQYTVTLISVTPTSEDGWFQWCYKMNNSNGTASGIDWFATCIPDCCTEKIEVQLVDDGFTQKFDPGEGETSNVKFGNLNQDCFVVKGTADDDTTRCFVANTDQMTPGTFALKYKGNAGSCELPIPRCKPAPEPPCVPQLGPGQSGINVIGTTLINRLNPAENKDICVVISDAAACVAELYDVSCDQINGSSPVGTTASPILVPIGGAAGIVGFTGPLEGSPLCPTGAIEINAGGCWAVYVGGRPIAYIPTGCN